MIKVITIGTIKEKYLKDAISEYQKRLQKYTNLEIIELKDEGLVEIDKALHLEGEKIKKHLNDKDYIITLEIEGQQLDSIEFSKKLEKVQLESSNIVFIIGGSYGLSSEIKAKAIQEFCKKNNIYNERVRTCQRLQICMKKWVFARKY